MPISSPLASLLSCAALPAAPAKERKSRYRCEFAPEKPFGLFAVPTPISFPPVTAALPLASKTSPKALTVTAPPESVNVPSAEPRLPA